MIKAIFGTIVVLGIMGMLIAAGTWADNRLKLAPSWVKRMVCILAAVAILSGGLSIIGVITTPT